MGDGSDGLTGGSAKTSAFLTQEGEAIVDEAGAALGRAHSRHYDSAGEREVHHRLETLFDHLASAIRDRDVTQLVDHARRIAEDRFNAGYDLGEVQTAFNALEEATWTRAVAVLNPADLAQTLGLVTTALGAGKDALARRYVSLASNTHAPSLDLRSLFGGTDQPGTLPP